MISLGRKGQGESLIKLLVIAIIAVIALALAKSYFRESAQVTQQTVDEIFAPESFIPAPSFYSVITSVISSLPIS
jgi:hypothetical protein